MVSNIDDILGSRQAFPPASPISGDDRKTGGGFDAALKAAQQAEEHQSAYRSMREEIADKGFSDWVRDTKMEALKEKLRRMVMAEMGIDDESLGRMNATVQQILGQKIQEEVERRMAEQAGDEEKIAGQPGKKDQEDGKTVPVIPTLAWPGGASIG